MKDQLHIRLATIEDREKIMSFIRNNWLKNHILGNDISFFEYQYKYGKNLQFILAVSSEKIIKGVLGFLQYDPKNKNQDIFLAFWKVIHTKEDKMLGIRLLEYLIKNIKHSNIHSVGIDKKIINIFKFLRFNTGKLDHYVAFNKFCKNFIISKPPLNLKK